jgi:hypothetical protein
MDDYAKFFLMRIRARESDFSDVSSRMSFKVECENFEWYLKHVYPLQLDPLAAVGQGKLRNVKFATKCVEMTKTNVKIEDCRNKPEQFIVLSENSELRRDDFCLSRRSSGIIKFDYCMNIESQQLWSYNNVTKQLFHMGADECLAIDTENDLALAGCGENAAEQKWTFEYAKHVHY